MFKSLFCLQGYDNGLRVFAVVALTHMALIILNALLQGAGLVIGVGCCGLAILSAVRRINDTQQDSKWLTIIALPLFVSLLMLWLGSHWSLILVNLAASALLLLLLSIQSAAEPRLYQYGYDGPANDTMAIPVLSRERVEPTLLDGDEPGHDEPDDEMLTLASTSPTAKTVWKPNAGWLRPFMLLQNKLLSVGLTLVILPLVIGLWPETTATEPTQQVEQAEPDTPAEQLTPSAKVKLADGLGLTLYDDVLALDWLGEEGQARELWSQLTAKGDKSCAYAEFNNGSRYRPLDVSVNRDSVTEARFSPLDTQALVKDVALRGNIKLCGYRFSLKGSQAALSKVDAFVRLIE